MKYVFTSAPVPFDPTSIPVGTPCMQPGSSAIFRVCRNPDVGQLANPPQPTTSYGLIFWETDPIGAGSLCGIAAYPIGNPVIVGTPVYEIEV